MLDNFIGELDICICNSRWFGLCEIGAYYPSGKGELRRGRAMLSDVCCKQSIDEYRVS
jgi:hypothetical protein